MAVVRWGLWVQGRIRTRVVLADGGHDGLAELSLRGKLPRRPAGGHAIGRDDRWWDVVVSESTATVRCGDVLWVSATDDQLTVGDSDLMWRPRWDGTRRVDVWSAEGRPLLSLRPGLGEDAPWATLDIDAELPASLPVALAATFVALRSDVINMMSPGDSGGSTGIA